MQTIRPGRWVWFVAWAGLVAIAPAHATIYTWTDAHGVRHYSDTSQPGAKAAQLSQSPAAGAPSRAATSLDQSSKTAEGDSRALTVISPQQGQVFASEQGQVPVSIIVGNNDDKSGLGDGESLRYELDGGAIGPGPTRNMRLTLSNVAAGSHTFSVTLLYRGHAVQHSDAVTFRVERGSDARPAQPPPATADGRPPS
ncbi:MAG: DUF4124 domain-containing protein [Salinisphaera sp.]|uniref:DUF4124 domain-containing protein n=1 Tax=Salinisphaera sp. TaxID=1914330 RepID=UPI003C7D363C